MSTIEMVLFGVKILKNRLKEGRIIQFEFTADKINHEFVTAQSSISFRSAF